MFCVLFQTRGPSPSAGPVSSGRDTRGPRRDGYPSTCKVKAVRVKVPREHFKSESSPRGVKARSQGSIAKVKAQSRQVPREHCNVIERSLDCRIRIKLTIEFFTIDSLSFDI